MKISRQIHNLPQILLQIVLFFLFLHFIHYTLIILFNSVNYAILINHKQTNSNVDFTLFVTENKHVGSEYIKIKDHSLKFDIFELIRFNYFSSTSKSPL